MTSTQRVIKGFAIALATFIICLIASSIISVINFVIFVFEPYEKSTTEETTAYEYDNISYLDIDLGSVNLEINEGTKFRVELSDSEIVKVTNTKNTVKIRQQNTLFWDNDKSKVKIYIPNTLEEIDIDIGAGKLSIENLTANKFDLEQGAGYVSIKNSTFDTTEIDGGAGKIEIDNSTLRNLNFNTGVGNTTITNSRIPGKSNISVGVGSVNIELKDYQVDYKIIASKGLGSLKIDGQDLDGTIGTGSNELKIDGGVGSITVDFNGLIKIN